MLNEKTLRINPLQDFLPAGNKHYDLDLEITRSNDTCTDQCWFGTERCDHLPLLRAGFLNLGC